METKSKLRMESKSWLESLLKLSLVDVDDDLSWLLVFEWINFLFKNEISSNSFESDSNLSNANEDDEDDEEDAIL